MSLTYRRADEKWGLLNTTYGYDWTTNNIDRGLSSTRWPTRNLPRTLPGIWSRGVPTPTKVPLRSPLSEKTP